MTSMTEEAIGNILSFFVQYFFLAENSRNSGIEIAPNQLMEIIGTKGPQGELMATAVCKLPEGDIDGELWNQAVQMAHHPKLRHLFQPNSGA